MTDEQAPADLGHAGAVVDKAIEYMVGQNIGALSIASATGRTCPARMRMPHRLCCPSRSDWSMDSMRAIRPSCNYHIAKCKRVEAR